MKFYIIKYLLVSTFLMCFSFTNAQKTITESETMRFRAQIEQNTATLNDLIADDLVYIHSNALTESKQEFIESVQSGKITYKTMEPESGRKIRTYKKTGISNGILRVTGIFQGNPFDVKLKYTAVYKKNKGKWLLTSWQSTSIIE